MKAEKERIAVNIVVRNLLSNCEMSLQAEGRSQKPWLMLLRQPFNSDSKKKERGKQTLW